MKHAKRTIHGNTYYWQRVKINGRWRDVYGKTVKELGEKVKAIKRQGKRASPKTFGAYMKMWLKEVCFIDKSPVTIETYTAEYNNYIRGSTLGKTKLNALTPEMVNAFYADIIASGKSANVCRNLNKIVRPCLRYAYKTRAIMVDIGNLIILPRREKKKPIQKPLTIEEQEKFIKACKTSKYGNLFVFDILTGLRFGEVCALKWSDVDFSAGSIVINKSVKYVMKEGRRQFVVGRPKTAASIRTIYIPDAALKILRRQKEKSRGVLVFPSTAGGYLDNSNVNKELKKVFDRAKIAGRRFHDLRHTCATRLFEIGISPKDVQDYLGHADLAITMNVYTHVVGVQKKEIATRINKNQKNFT